VRVGLAPGAGVIFERKVGVEPFLVLRWPLL
jgi:hypothetical protein